MSKPAGKCAFCGEVGDLTKSHVWPRWAEDILPQTATHHEQIDGEFYTFVPKMAHSPKRRRVKPGHVGTRKPRNTCLTCNSGWMRHIEEAVIPVMTPLLRGDPCLLDSTAQKELAAFLCLVSMRVERASGIPSIPEGDREWLKAHRAPPAHWKIWLARYEGTYQIDQNYSGMHIASAPNLPTGIEHCNAQVTTLVIGHLCSHLFSCVEWANFRGYEGIELRQIWPLTQPNIQVALLPVIAEGRVQWLHEAIARESAPISEA